MSNEEVGCSVDDDLQLVYGLIEQCLLLHLSKRDTVNLILRDTNIEPAFTELVWEQLEQENRAFFEVYYIQVALKQQVETFNELLRQQATLAQHITIEAAPSPGSNGSHISGNGSHVSGNGSHMSGNGSVMPGNGYHTRENGSHVPENVSHVPENVSHVLENGSHRPVNGSKGPENGSHRPENGSHRPPNGSQRPENGSQRPANGSHRPENGSHRPENRSHRPVNGSHRPENGSHMHCLEPNGGCSIDEAGPFARSRNLQAAIPPYIPSAFTTGMSLLQTPTPFNLSPPSDRTDFLPNYNMLHIQSSNSTELIQGFNEEIINSESDYSDSQSIFHNNGNIAGTLATMEGAPFSCVEASSRILNESHLNIDDSSFGHFGNIPGNFSYSNLTTAYPDVLANFSNSSFGATIAGSFLVSQDGVEIPEDTSGGISESYNS